MIQPRQNPNNYQRTLRYKNDLSTKPGYVEYQQLQTQGQTDSQKYKIRNTLSDQVCKLHQEVTKRQLQLQNIKQKFKDFYQYQSKRRNLQIKERKLESELEDLQIYEEKIKKDMKVLVQEEQIKKGKTIVQHNKIIQIKQQQFHELKRAEVLEKHLDDINKGTKTLKKKIKSIKEEFKKKNHGRIKIQEGQIQQEVIQLQIQIQNKNNQLKALNQKKKIRCSHEDYLKLRETRECLKRQCFHYEEVQKKHIKLKDERETLEKRIHFLSNVDSQLINQKKSLIQELAQKHRILQTQKQSYAEQLKSYQQQLSHLEAQNQKSLQLSKKSRKKRQPIWKGQKKLKVEQIPMEQPFSQRQEKVVNRWKGKVLKRKCYLIFTILLILGLLLGSIAGLRF